MNELKQSLDKTILKFKDDIKNFRSISISTQYIDTIKVNYHGSWLQIKELAKTSKAVHHGGIYITVEPYDQSIAGTISKVLRDNALNAYEFSKTLIHVNVPSPTRDEKEKVIKHLKKLGEDAKISIRRIRRNYRDTLSKEELKEQDKAIQDEVNLASLMIDQAIQNKENNL